MLGRSMLEMLTWFVGVLGLGKVRCAWNYRPGMLRLRRTLPVMTVVLALSCVLVMVQVPSLVMRLFETVRCWLNSVGLSDCRLILLGCGSSGIGSVLLLSGVLYLSLVKLIGSRLSFGLNSVVSVGGVRRWTLLKCSLWAPDVPVSARHTERMISIELVLAYGPGCRCSGRHV